MTFRTTLLSASILGLACTAPAMAQDYPLEPLPADGRYAQVAQMDHDVVEAVHEAAGDGAEPHRMDNRSPGHHPMPHDAAPAPVRFGYTPAQREQWLADCRTVMRGEDYYHAESREDDDDGNGGLLGGLLGAVIGGIAGNRIGDGDRLAGTLIGAGIGGIAGAAIGSVIDADGGEDRYHDGRSREGIDAWAADYCDAYLRQYENGAGSQQLVYAQPMMLVPVAASHGQDRVVREEWVDVPRSRTGPPCPPGHPRTPPCA